MAIQAVKSISRFARKPSKKARQVLQHRDHKYSNGCAVYSDQELTRELPGQRNTMCVTDESGKKTVHQKHLLLMNIRELHHEHQKLNPDHPISVSKFTALRPKWCITVDSKGITNTCVCTKHQNVELMTEVLPTRTTTYALRY